MERMDSSEQAKTEHLVVSTMDDIVSLMVPLLCTLSPPVSNISDMLDGVSILSSVKDPVQRFQPVEFNALVSMRTDAYDVESSPTLLDEEVRPLSRSLVAHQRLLSSDVSLSSSTTHWLDKPTDERQREVKKTQEDFRNLERRIELEWTFDERSITVRCPKYVGGVLVLAGILVFGGLTAGISIHNRLKGVDPFNITTFCWILATFLVLVAQSIRVENWPWRDFLRGRVVCRSVRELCDVENLDEQHVLLYLLHNEHRLILNTRGPYNMPFRSQMSDGFSIDVKPELKTLLLSGIIVLKVATPGGPALVCLDVRKRPGNRLVGIDHFHSHTEGDNVLVCRDPPMKGESIRLREADIYLDRTPITWYRVIGLYNLAKCKFR
jgi:hypothetical protein